MSGSKSKRARKHIPASPLSLKRRRRRQLWFPPPGFGFGGENTAIHGSGNSGVKTSGASVLVLDGFAAGSV